MQTVGGYEFEILNSRRQKVTGVLISRLLAKDLCRESALNVARCGCHNLPGLTHC